MAAPSSSEPESFTHKYCEVNGIRMHYVDENASSPNALLLLHGWPDLWLGWREQIPFLVNLGYRVIVPTLRGFGETDAPADPAQYGFGTLSTDLKCLLDHLQLPTVTVIGHDWGGLLAWRFTQFYPDRVRAVASFCTPYRPASHVYVPLEDIVKKYPNFTYQLYLTTPEAEREIDTHTEAFFKRVFRPIAEMTDPLLDKTTGKLVEGRPELAKSDALPQRVLGYYVAAYKKRGARGGLNWYKQTRNNFEQCKDLEPMIHKQALMVTAAGDRALPPSMAEGMDKFIPALEIHHVQDSGHWILWEKPDECNAILKQWLAKVAPLLSRL